MKKKIILVGKAASGKDFFKNFLLEKGYKTSISHTTRPMRDGETEGIEYFFVTEPAFSLAVTQNFFFEFKKFNGWHYGTSDFQMRESNVFIFTPEGVKDLPRIFKSQCTIVYFDIDENIRLERLKKRSDSDTIERRLEADKEDFKDFKEYNIRIGGETFDCEYTLKKILSYEV